MILITSQTVHTELLTLAASIYSGFTVFAASGLRLFEPRLNSWLRMMAITVAVVNEVENMALSQG